MRTIGVELSLDTVRAVSLESWRGTPRTFECAWDPNRPADAVAQLRAHFGSANRVAISVALAFLHVKNVKLPPAPLLVRKRMLSLEPDRFFPVQDHAVVVALTEENIGFAVDAALLDRWIAAFAAWAPVEVVEPAPCSVARALGKTADGIYALPAAEGEHGSVELRAGHVQGVRRVPDAVTGLRGKRIPEHKGVPGEFSAALGAARGGNDAVDGMLLPAPLDAQIRSARVRRVALAAVLCAGAFGLSLWSVDRARERELAALRAEVRALAPRARGAEQLQDQIATLDREGAALSSAAGSSDPLVVMSAVSKQLPPGATVLNLRVNGEEWQIDGTAKDAAALVPLLDKDDHLENVRFLSASTRFKDGSRMVETFSIAFKVRPGD